MCLGPRFLTHQTSLSASAPFPVAVGKKILDQSNVKQGWREGSALRGCSPRGPRFGSQHPHGEAHNCLQLQFQGVSHPCLVFLGTPCTSKGKALKHIKQSKHKGGKEDKQKQLNGEGGLAPNLRLQSIMAGESGHQKAEAAGRRTLSPEVKRNEGCTQLMLSLLCKFPLHVCLYSTLTHGTRKNQKSSLDPLELEFKM